MRPVPKLRLLDTFAGIGGFSLAAAWLGGFETIGFVEREPFCQKILSKHWPNVPIHNDIRTFEPELGSADVICGGFPCQDISTAGKQAGIKQGTRSGLFYELIRVVCMVRPQYIVLENVAAILNNGLDVVLGELATAGFNAEWACIPASAVGACHQRDRWWLVAYSNGLHCKRWRNPEYMAGPQGTSQIDGKKWKRNGNAFDDCSANVADAGCQRLQGAWQSRSAANCLNANWNEYVSKPVIRRGDDGFSGRVDRLKALGNAVVPQVAMIPLKRVLDLHQDLALPGV